MKSNKVLGLFVVAFCSAIAVNAQDKAFKTDPATGVRYRFVKHNAKGEKPTEKDLAHIVMLWTGKNTKGDADSVFLDSHKKGGDSAGVLLQAIPLKKTFQGSLEQGILMMAKGDSAIFKINSDSLIYKTFHYPANRPLPAYVKTNPTFTFSIKLVSFQTQEEMMAAKLAEIQANKAKEKTDITTYLQKNNPNVKPDADSIFYLQVTKGTGPQVQEGDSLDVKYKGMFLNGEIFDQSEGRGNGTLPVHYKQPIPLIKGWISVLGKMNQGDKVRVLIPSAMAYGVHGNGRIQPYTPLIFEMELVYVKSNK
ncbi:MAG TPA: FKBP-type peptidyl-prolyl cis-trans isomerase [Bacteroidia bacterium]|jgi:FKBP-type peptidyl-prolyl cis-trans isomerase|nr:FKBP-type peptidyl-prolyl cis-trans isomerase [Bacteroidia bacterium]